MLSPDAGEGERPQPAQRPICDRQAKVSNWDDAAGDSILSTITSPENIRTRTKYGVVPNIRSGDVAPDALRK